MQKNKNFLIRNIIGGVGLAATVVVGLPMAQAKETKGTVHATASHRTTRLTQAQAEAVVLRRFPGKVIEAPLEHEGGKWQYGVLVRSGRTLRDVMVNAYGGKIDSVTITTMAKERAEKRAEAATKKK